jgi:hypothetical protein
MNKLQLYKLLRKNINLSYRRSPAFEQNRWAKVLIGFGGLMFILYLILYGIIIGMAAKGEEGTLIMAMIIILPIDFLLRFIFQTTPSMMVKPYILLPISRYSAIECFLFSSHFSGFNFLWLGLFLPFAIIVLFGGASWGATLFVVLLAQLLIILNSQIYLFFRTLINRNVLWLIPGLLIYCIPFIPALITMSRKTLEHTLDNMEKYCTAWWLLPLVLLALCALFMVNRYFQFKYVYEEISKQKEKQLKRVSQFAFFNRFGIIGEYLKIELKSNLRNKMMKQRCIMSLTLVVVFSMLIAYTSIYDNPMMINFWCLYCFSIYGITVLIKIMGQEGNYISLLMTQRENILSLLKAKYYFHVAILLVPLLLMLPAVIAGKFSLLMMAAYLFLCSGLLYFMLFQLAVYNKQTLPLNQKITGKNNAENGVQLIIVMVGMFSPLVLVALFIILFDENTAYTLLAIIGLVITLLHPIWLRHIYKRMMLRKYDNLEGFHASR